MAVFIPFRGFRHHRSDFENDVNNVGDIMSEHEIYRFLTESERAGEWSFPKTDGTSVISKHGKFWIDTDDLSWHEDAEIPDVEKFYKNF